MSGLLSRINDGVPRGVSLPWSDWTTSWLGLALVAVLSLGPLLATWAGQDLGGAPANFLPPHPSALADWGSKALVAVLMGLAIGVRVRIDRRHEPWAGRLALGLVVVAGAMVAWHWYIVDSAPDHAEWQREHYLLILNRREVAPHQFRALPYGFTRGLEWLTGDWRFACLAYRWFFTYWFLWGCYRFARVFHGPASALVRVVPVCLLYPLSVLNYLGQLTDPLSHALFVLALIYVVRDCWARLAAALFLGVLAKETVVLMVPAYLACFWRRRWRTLARTAALGMACVAAFFLARLPLGWHLGYDQINGTEGLMIGSNLGVEWPALGIEKLYTSTVPFFQLQNYLHPLVFVGTFLPFIAWRWRQIDPRLRAIFLTLVPLLLASNLCFGWMYESRNYMPLVPLLATMVRPPRADPIAPDAPRTARHGLAVS